MNALADPPPDRALATALGTAMAWPTPTVEEPDLDSIEAWVFDGVAEATDGCEVEADGYCPDGHPSWLVAWGLL